MVYVYAGCGGHRLAVVGHQHVMLRGGRSHARRHAEVATTTPPETHTTNYCCSTSMPGRVNIWCDQTTETAHGGLFVAVTSIALMGFLGAGNIGNDASLEVVLQWFAKHSSHTRITLITSDPARARATYELPTLPMTLCPPLGPRGVFHKVRRVAGRISDFPRLVVLAGQYDAVIIPGMGVLEDSLPVGPWGFPLTLAISAVACKALRHPFVLLDVGAENSTDRRLESMFATTARAAKHVSCRDSRSADAIARWTHTRPSIHPDLVFAHQATLPPDAAYRRGIVIGVMGGDWENAYQGTRPVRGNYVTTLTEVGVSLLDDGHDLTLTGGDDADHAVMQTLHHAITKKRPQLAERLKMIKVKNYTELTAVMSRAELVVASRYHNLICAMACASPTISVSYAGKCTDLLYDIDMGHHSHDIRTVASIELLEDIHAVLGDAADISRRLSCTSAERAVGARALMDKVLGSHL